jgi:hypothetical protein
MFARKIQQIVVIHFRRSNARVRYTGCSTGCTRPHSLWRKDMASERSRSIDEIIRRVQGEFLEMPGLRLTEPQARRLWGLDAVSCSALLDALIDAEFLFRTRDGAFMRVERAATASAKAQLRRREKPAAA